MVEATARRGPGPKVPTPPPIRHLQSATCTATRDQWPYCVGEALADSRSMNAVLDIDHTLDEAETATRQAAAATVGAEPTSAPTPSHEALRTPAADKRDGFGHQVLLSLPLSLVVVFVAATVGIAGRTDTLAAAVGFGLFLAFWLGGGFGFLIAGIRWGLLQEAADHDRSSEDRGRF